jgi:hypothetical protein
MSCATKTTLTLAARGAARIAGHGPTLFAGPSKRVDLKLASRLEFGSGAAQRGRGGGVGELWAVAGSAAGIQVVVAGVKRCDPSHKNIRSGESERV